MGIRAANFVSRPAVIEIVLRNLRDPNSRHSLQMGRTAVRFHNMRVSNFDWNDRYTSKYGEILPLRSIPDLPEFCPSSRVQPRLRHGRRHGRVAALVCDPGAAG